MRAHLEDLPARADLFLLAGDLTKSGHPAEAEVLAKELAGLTVPTIAVLGNHDYHAERAGEVRDVLENAGLHVLEGEAVVMDVDGTRVGVAGAKGFGGGFMGACGTEFGEPEMKAFIRHTRELAERLERALRRLQADLKVALLHYSPVEGTLAGERPEIHPFLGSYLLGEAVDRGGADLALHGHAHNGREKGTTPGGTHVRNVSMPLIGHAYKIYRVGGRNGVVGGESL